MQPRCKNATSGAYDAPLVAGCLDFGPPGTLRHMGGAVILPLSVYFISDAQDKV